MRPPRFWSRDGLVPRLLAPAAAVTAAVTARRLRTPGWRAPVPVLCCGNAAAGGAGKTTLVLDLAARLVSGGRAVHCLTRGYGGAAKGPLRVDLARHAASLVGDEPLLLAAICPTWVGADRAASARLAVAAGADCLLMDDGLQNPGLHQDAALLVIDGATGFGNGRVIPAGPLREPAAAAASRCRAAVLIGADVAGARAALPAGLPVLDASLVPDRDLGGTRVFAFAGIGRPGKFYETLSRAGAVLAGTRDFPDHHVFSEAELGDLAASAGRLGARLITTPKDAARLGNPPGLAVAGVTLRWVDEAALDDVLSKWLRPGTFPHRAAGP